MNRLFIFDARLRIACLFLAFFGCMAGFYLFSQHLDPAAFIFRGTIFEGVSNGSIGYDGQFAYAIANDPLGASRWLPEPAYRYQRIIYPLLVCLLSLGQPAVLPWAMVLINLLALAACGWLLADLLKGRGASHWYSLVFLAFGGTLFVLLMDLNEPLTFLLVLLGIKFLDQKKFWLSGIAFAMGGLTKEVALVFAAAAAFWLVISCGNWRAALKVLGVSGLVFLVWGVVVSNWLPDTILRARMSRMEWIPFGGLFYIKDLPTLMIDLCWIILPVLVLGVLAVLDFRKIRPVPLETFFILANVLLIVFMPRFTWVDWIASLRLGMGLVIASLLYLAQSHQRLGFYLYPFWSASIILPIAFIINVANT
jgi:hypothetical protein